jgi:hypothetical protein
MHFTHPKHTTANTQRRAPVAEPVEAQRAMSAYKRTTAPTVREQNLISGRAVGVITMNYNNL